MCKSEGAKKIFPRGYWCARAGCADAPGPSYGDCEVAKSAVEPVSCWLRTTTRERRCRRVRKGFRQNVASAIRSAMLRPVFVGVPLVFPPTDNPVGDPRCCLTKPSACGRKRTWELPPGPASIQPAPAALSWPPPGPVAADTSGAGPAGVQPAPAALSGPPPGPAAADASGAPPTQQDTIARTGFDVHGNPAATPGPVPRFSLTRCCTSGSSHRERATVVDVDPGFYVRCARA